MHGRNEGSRDDSDDGSTAIPACKLMKLHHSISIKRALSSSRLQEVLTHIDGAKNREKALMAKLDTDPDFVSFMNEVVLAVGYAKKVKEVPSAVLFHGVTS